VFIEAKDDGGSGDNWTTGAVSRAKLQSDHHHQQTNIQVFYRPDALPVAQPTVSKHCREMRGPGLTWDNLKNRLLEKKARYGGSIQCNSDVILTM